MGIAREGNEKQIQIRCHEGNQIPEKSISSGHIMNSLINHRVRIMEFTEIYVSDIEREYGSAMIKHLCNAWSTARYIPRSELSGWVAVWHRMRGAYLYTDRASDEFYCLSRIASAHHDEVYGL